MNLIDVTKQFQTDEECLKLHRDDALARWRCALPDCGCDRISRITRKIARARTSESALYQCLEATCKQQFSATSWHDLQ